MEQGERGMPNWSKNKEDKILVGIGVLRRLAMSGVWHFHFKDERGEWVTKSTGHRDRAGAATWAQAYSMDETRRKFGIAPKAVRADDDAEKALDEWLEYQQT